MTARARPPAASARLLAAMMARTLLFGCALVGLIRPAGTQAAPLPRGIVSGSGQFVIHDGRTNSIFKSYQRPLRNVAASKLETVRLGPETLAISAERVKQALLRELNLQDRGARRVHLTLTPARSPDQGIGLVSTLYADGWRYDVEVPDEVEPVKLIRGVVQGLLLEFANRTSASRSAEIPLWLTEGLVAEIAASAGQDLVLQSVPQGLMLRTARDLKGLDVLREAREKLRANAPLTFGELSQPTALHLTGDSQKIFQSSAQLFTHALLRQTNGPARLAAMLRELPQCWNWQTAFLRAFQADFPRLLEVEKWWSLTLVEFTGRDPSQVWTTELSLKKLAELLVAPVQVSRSSNALPERAEVPVSQIILDWPSARQQAALRGKISQLLALRYNSPVEAVPMIDAYRTALENYLRRRAEVEKAPENKRRVDGLARLVAQQALRELAALDLQRQALLKKRMAAADPAPSSAPQSAAPGR